MFIDKNNIRFYIDKNINTDNHFKISKFNILKEDIKIVEFPDKKDLGIENKEIIVIHLTGTLDEPIKGGYELSFPDTDDTIYVIERCHWPQNTRGNINLGTGDGAVILKNNCFSFSNLKSVVIGKNCSVEGEYCFYRNNKLKLVDFGNSRIESIPAYMFSQCGLEKVILPPNLKKLKIGSFISCTGLKSITFPNTLEYIGEIAFYNATSLREIIFTGKLPKIRYDSFSGIIRSYVKIYVPDEYISSYKKYIMLKYFNILPLSSHISSFGVKLIGKTGIEIVQKLNNTGDENLYTGIVKIPKYLYDYNKKKRLVKNIDPYAFFGCENLKEIIIPRSLKRKDLVVNEGVEIKYHDED